ncbi:FAD-binding oxidoreductase [Reyranella sp. CPCC 100927]|uniref:NAD(P)/FAD-dependent oxidoreductase n=1 Tax=Reyranella sp. CPCC 100927 TaxID=2599616 RepID=UPI0011B5BF44|nr:FAD-dependent oxidoreductase [Reyranella sp. CPCC 100927]TWT15493.1 FAD-binding oxidoreductase [Reyranella sp. CPCC 100927]
MASSPVPAALPVAVIGAGIVGMATARALQRAGRQVVVLDNEDPGRKTSFGNAGFIAIDHVLPLCRPDVLRRVPKMLRDPNGPLTIHLPSLLWLLPWMARFALAARDSEVKKGVDAFGTLMEEANASWKSEIQSSNLGELFRSLGALYVYETEAGFQSGAHERALQAAKGTAMEIVDGNRARELAPGLAPHIVKGVYYPHGMHTISPYHVVTALAERFVAEGGRIEKAKVTGIDVDGNRATAVRMGDRVKPVDAVVICAGRASGDITRHLRFRAPLVAERGYHVMVEPTNVRFTLPVSPSERGFFITPMREGLRLAGTVELGAPDKPPSWHRADLLVKHLKSIFPGVGGAETSRWMGERPSLPDFRPAIGRAPHHHNVYCGYGHQHVGLTLATATARLIVRLMDGEALPPTLASCDPGRFGS